jgi:hypothetical protein
MAAPSGRFANASSGRRSSALVERHRYLLDLIDQRNPHVRG